MGDLISGIEPWNWFHIQHHTDLGKLCNREGKTTRNIWEASLSSGMQVLPGRGWRLCKCCLRPKPRGLPEVQLRSMMLLTDYIFDTSGRPVRVGWVQHRGGRATDGLGVTWQCGNLCWGLLCWDSVLCELHSTRKGDDYNVKSVLAGRRLRCLKAWCQRTVNVTDHTQVWRSVLSPPFYSASLPSI